MPDGLTVTFRGGRELRRQLQRLERTFAGELLETAVVAGGMPILNQAKRNVHKVTGTLGRSLHIGGHTNVSPGFRQGEGYGDIGGAVREDDYAEVQIGSDLEYARREEMGFLGQDRLGRHYAFEGHPYLRPAFDEKRDEAVRETGEALKDLLRRLGR